LLFSIWKSMIFLLLYCLVERAWWSFVTWEFAAAAAAAV
jgi:hypothetical protein